MVKPNTRPKQPERGWAVQLPEGGFEHPFQDSDYHYTESRQGKEHPRTVVELRMCALSHRIREQPGWWEKVKDKAAVRKWREEALQEEEENDVAPSWKLTPTMINYVLEELHGYASLRDPETGIEVGPAERIWKSDTLIPNSLRRSLLAAVAPLEAVPDSERDWNPGSNGFVLNLVHPSLYPIVYGRTMGKVSGSDTATILGPPTELEGANPEFVSKRFQWLPSDFSVDGHGKVTLTSPYINNVHPIHHKELYSVIPVILQHAIPMFERVLSDLLRPLLPMRIATSDGREFADCIWKTSIPSTPDSRKQYGGDLKVMNNRISLKGRTLQIIVRLSNIILTPERPEYPGGNWHVEGMRNDMIVSSFIYYYDSVNISECKLSFRRATSEPQVHNLEDNMCMKLLYDMDWGVPCVQGVGDVITKTQRCVAFPNLYQHRLQPFRLEDPTRPGHRRILVFFLVDPTQKVLSSTDVAPQQGWVTKTTHDTGPPTVRDRKVTMTRSEAKKYRQELMSERVIFAEENNRAYFGVPRPRYLVLRGD